MAQVELIGSEFDPAAEEKKKEAAANAPEKKRTIAERARALTGGGKKKEKTERPKVQKAAKGARKVSTPRKAGGGS